jgi:serine/threonine-protein kinase
MGTVWKARDNLSGEVIALKILHEHYADDEGVVSRFEREVEVTRRIDSEYVAKTLGFGRREGRPFTSMEYVEGPSLRAIVREGGPLPWAEARRLLRHVALGLEAAHAAGVVHRDVKPSNIIVTPAGTAKLVDFGIALAEDLTSLTGTSATLGTPAYMAPEPPGPQADLYALGCVAFEVLTGEPPFKGESQQEIVVKHLREEPDLSRLPPDARPTVGWLLKKKLQERAPRASLVAAVLEGASTVPRRGIGRSPAALRPVLLGVAGALAAVLAASLGWVLLGGGDNEPPVSPAGQTVVVTGATLSPSPRSPVPPSATATPTPVSTDGSSFPTATSTPTPTQTPSPPPTVAPAPTTATVVAPTEPPAPAGPYFSLEGPASGCPGTALILAYQDVATETVAFGTYRGPTVTSAQNVIGGPGRESGFATYPTYSPLTPGTYRLDVVVNGQLVASRSIEVFAENSPACGATPTASAE